MGSKIRRYNNRACFGHRLTHIIGKLLLIPTNSSASMSKEVREQIASVYSEDNERKQDDENIDGKKYSEPDENGKYQLKKALMYHANGLDDQRAAYYLGEANWNVRNALKKWREDDTWEKMHRVMTTCSLSQEEAMLKLAAMNYNEAAVIKQWKKEQQKDTKLMARIKKLGRNYNNKEVNELGGIEMNEKSTPKGTNDKEQEETKGDGDEMNEGQTAVSSNVTGTMETSIQPVEVNALETANKDTAAFSDAVIPKEDVAAEQEVVSVDEITLQ